MKQGPQTAKDLISRLKTAGPREFAVLEKALSADTRITVKRALQAARKRIDSDLAERNRVGALYHFDISHSSGIVLGLDEVGRGPIAGPLAVGGVVLSADSPIERLDDSKRVPEKIRDSVAFQIKECALAWSVCFIEPQEIDQLGMSACLRNAFKMTIDEIERQGVIPDCILLDGLPLGIDKREIAIVKGDTKSASIAAASILAKTERDALMTELAQTYPEYGFEKNKGYGSEEHRQAIQRFGLSPVHRSSFCSGFLQESLF